MRKLSPTQIRTLRLLAKRPMTDDELREQRIGMNMTVHGLKVRGLVEVDEIMLYVNITEAGRNHLKEAEA